MGTLYCLSPPLIQLSGYEALEKVWEDSTGRLYRAVSLDDGRPVFVRFRSTAVRWDPGPGESGRPLPPGATFPQLDSRPHETGVVSVFHDDGSHPLDAASRTVPPTVDHFLDVAMGLAEALVLVHAQHLVHTAISGREVWVHPQTRRVRLTGHARPLRTSGPEGTSRSLSMARLTYVAPEQTGRLNRPVDARTDLYSAGVLLYEFLVGHPPFVSSEPLELIHAHLAQAPASLGSARPDLPEVLERLVLKLLAKNPEDRYQTASGLMRDLEKCRAQWTSEGEVGSFDLGSRDTASDLRMTDRLYGRKQEVAALLEAVARSAHTRSGLALVSGPPGVGKSALVACIQKPIAGGGGFFLSGKFEQLGHNAPYSALIQAFQRLVHQLLGGSREDVGRWRQRLRSSLGNNAQLVIDVIPEVELITGPAAPVTALPLVESRNRFNMVFTDFILGFAQPERPVVLFLDDLQWADAASLALLENLLANDAGTGLFVLGACRDEEVDAGRPLRLAVDRIQNGGTPVLEVLLGNLTPTDVAEMLTDTLACDVERTMPLAHTLHRKTDGNPLFVVHLLQVLVEDGLLSFDAQRGRWEWELARIDGEGVTDDVTELMTRKLTRLPAETLAALGSAACLGGRFGIRALAQVLDRSLHETRSSVEPAVAAGVLLTDVALNGLRFLHDRVQEAAYQSIPPEDRMRRHYEVGTRLWDATSADALDDDPFPVLQNLNQALELLGSPAKRAQAAALNLTAARRARSSNAYEDALGYLGAGISLLAKDSWIADYDLSYALHRERLACVHMVGDMDRADALLAELLGRARTREEKADLHETNISRLTRAGRHSEAIQEGVQALRLFGLTLPANAGRGRVLIELIRTRVLIGTRGPRELEALPEMTASDIRTVLDLLMAVAPAAYMLSTNTLVVVALKIVQLSVRHGNGPVSPYGYLLYAMVLGSILGRYELSDAYGRLALALSQRGDQPVLRLRALQVFSSFISHWRRPVQASRDLLSQVYTQALELGDHEYANYAILGLHGYGFDKGDHLSHVEAAWRRTQPFAERTGVTFSIHNHELWLQAAVNLQGRSEDPVILDTERWDEAEALSRIAQEGTKTSETGFFILKLQLATLFRSFDAAFEHGARANEGIDWVVGQMMYAQHHFYWGLAAAGLMRTGNGGRAARNTFNRCRRKFSTWAKHCAENFEHQYLLLEAEAAALKGRDDAAFALYDRAIESASDAGFVHVVALANELAGRHYEAHGRPKAARPYLIDAVAAFDRWGAGAKVDALVAEYPWLESERTRLVTQGPVADSETSGSILLELDAVMRAAGAISQETDLERLIGTLLELVLESSGAQRGVVVFVDGENLRVEAEATAGSPVQLVSSEPVGSTDRACPTIVQYVARTGQDLILNDARSDPRYEALPYVASRHPRSILCSPILRGGETLGVLYLENNLTTGAFAAPQLKLLRLIASDAAIALQNARLAGRSAQQEEALGAALGQVNVLEHTTHHLSKFVPRSVRQIIEENPEAPELDKREEDLSVLFLDLAGYTRMSETLEQEQVDQLVERFFSEFLDEIHDHGGDINETAGDGLMIIFRSPDPQHHARSAALAALGVQRRTARLNQELETGLADVRVNIGINSGLASVGSARFEGATGTRYTYTASGSVTNLASRIGSMAHGGEVLMSEVTAERLGAWFETQARGEHAFKNVAGNISVFQLVEPTDT